ncbi:ribosome small subunit-dependent GTPase A [Psittacicella hinzii]|uniref:Small ribosomal subunit biogenesis GTPase RsgA n=1 Tax=Psittacicella hinzii TaxID=2028575 RepID=A0A3A1YFZ5_9GAMM|nr:ribosome small subunit-dependent GTPase A [Psittacicella hinzii]RIY36471.1 ribosome small subunit-dependent GTPase A [Psittacicella hinzii]
MTHNKKRHLSKKQQENIHRNRQSIIQRKQEKHNKELSNIESFVADNQQTLEIHKGIIISRYGKSADVMPLNDDCFTDSYVRCFMKASLDDLVVGDIVYYYQINEQQYFIVEKEERFNLISRYYFNKERNVVANVSTMIITSSINPVLNTEIIDRYLIVAENCKVKPLIIINKVDLIDNPEQQLEVERIINYYHELGYTIFATSTKTHLNIDKIISQLDQGIHIFVGQTGVGKSSLINAIFGKELMLTGEINSDTRLGKHTTTTSRLFKINDHSALIDSPGIREFSVDNYTEQEVIYGYKELRDPNYACRFSDCNHHNNLGCGIQRIHAENKIADFRYQNLLHLLNIDKSDK